ncbi:MAG: translesion error-prone DNA polymerase V autoproteolytic subunit [Proteobacteria bacterium]|nr:translesion error-prone DNA polymerase V autoproteolytic subunit [Pseudomonadota bacterium]
MNSHGGKRDNAGRPLGLNAYGEPTVPIRVPKSQVTQIKDYLKAYSLKNIVGNTNFYGVIHLAPNPKAAITLPLFSSKVSAGFPSPADDHIEKRLDINDYLIEQPDATFLVTITGLSMRDAGLLPKDIAIIDRSKDAAVGSMVMAIVDGEFTIKYLGLGEDGNPVLISANPDFKPIEIKENMQFEIWGVVIGSIRKYP